MLDAVTVTGERVSSEVQAIIDQITPDQFPDGALDLPFVDFRSHLRNRRVLWPGQEDSKVLGYPISAFTVPHQNPLNPFILLRKCRGANAEYPEHYHSTDLMVWGGIIESKEAKAHKKKIESLLPEPNEFAFDRLDNLRPVFAERKCGEVEVIDLQECDGFKVGDEWGDNQGRIDAFVKVLWEYDGIWARVAWPEEVVRKSFAAEIYGKEADHHLYIKVKFLEVPGLELNPIGMRLHGAIDFDQLYPNICPC